MPGHMPQDSKLSEKYGIYNNWLRKFSKCQAAQYFQENKDTSKDWPLKLQRENGCSKDFGLSKECRVYLIK